jgi:hypothetical protein
VVSTGGGVGFVVPSVSDAGMTSGVVFTGAVGGSVGSTCGPPPRLVESAGEVAAGVRLDFLAGAVVESSEPGFA